MDLKSMSDDFHFDIKRDSNDFPVFIEGNRVGINEQGRHFVTIGGRKWVLAPNEPPFETASDPEQFQILPQPPRQVTLIGKLTLLCGSGITGLLLFGGIFACFGMIFVCLFVGAGTVDTYPTWRENGTANVTTIEKSSFSINDDSVFAYSFSGHDVNGNEVTGTSYAFENQFKEDQTVTLKQTNFFGEKWKLEGANFSMCRNPMGHYGLMIFLFPIVGVCVVFFGTILPGLKHSSLVTYGELTLASFLRQESTNTSINDRTVQKLVFLFETPDGEQYEASLKTLEPEKFLSDTCRKIVFYHPGNPKKSMVWENVASMMKYDEFQQHFTGFTINIPVFLVFVLVFGFELVWFFHNVATGKMFF